MPEGRLGAYLTRSTPEFPAGLESGVVSAIRRAEARRWFSARLSVWVALAGVVASIWSFGGSLAGSDFWTLVRLAFSDGETLLEYQGEFLLSLAETFPAVGFSVVIAAVFAFALSVLIRYDAAGPRRRFV